MAQVPYFAKSVELPFASRHNVYWATPSEKEDVQRVTYREQALRLAGALTLGTAAFQLPRAIGKKPANFWFDVARTLEEAFPGRILQTFRVSEAISASLARANPRPIVISDLSSRQRVATGNYLRNIMGIDVTLTDFHEFKFIPEKGTPFGSLVGVSSSGRQTQLASRVRAMRPGRVFEAFTSIAQPGMFHEVARSKDIFGGVSRTRWVPVPTQGRIRDVITGARSYGAFAIQRLGELMERVAESNIRVPQFLGGGSLGSALKRTGLLNLTPKRGPVVPTLMRYGGFASKLGLGYLALSHLDAWRNSPSLMLTLGAMAGTSAWASHIGGRVAKKLGKSVGKGRLIGLAASALQLTPMFGHGVKAGVSSVPVNLNQLRSRIGEATGMNAMRRWFEANMPASTGVGTALFMGIFGAGLGYQGTRIRELAKGRAVGPARVLDIYPVVRDLQETAGGPKAGPFARMRVARLAKRYPEHLARIHTNLGLVIEEAGGSDRVFSTMKAHDALEVAARVRSRFLDEAAGSITQGPWWKRELQRFAAGAKAGRWASMLRPIGILSAAWFTMTGGLGTAETPEELADIYSGRQLTPVRRGRYWEMGGTPYEGTDTLYWRKHWYPRMIAKARAAGQASRWPVEEFIAKNFSYAIERDMYYKRPYAITGAAFDQVPFIYPFLRPFGDLIKPARLMHVPDWARVGPEGDIQLKYVEDALTPQPVMALGGLPPSAPVSPYSPGQMLRRAFYETTELAGLVGWATQGAYSTVTDAAFPFAEEAIIQPASDIGSMRRAFWAEQMGGAFLGVPFMSETVRRFLPAYPSAIEEYSPVRNKLPQWFPEDLRYGDPYINIRYGLGEERLPSSLYEQLYNVGEQGYTLPHRLEILSGVASWSPEYRKTQRQATAFIAQNPDSPVSAYMTDTMARLAAKRQKLDPDYYINRSSGFGRYDSEGNLRDVNEAVRRDGAFANTVGKAWEGFIHGVGKVLSPLEAVGPAGFAPWSKLAAQRDPIEHYEGTNLYGTQYRFWSDPWGNWLRPALNQARRYWAGDKDTPGNVQEARDINEYYDKIKWYKYQRLAAAAEQAGYKPRASEYRRVAKSTRFGANPYGGTSSLKYTLPYGDRQYFAPFSLATTDEAKSRIMAMIPAEQRAIYQGVWDQSYGRALRARQALGTITAEGEATLQQIEQRRAVEGRPYSSELYARYQKDPGGMSFADWSRMKEIEAFFANRELPDPDWVGWNPSVDLEDVKLKHIMDEGRDYHDFGMFASRVRALGRKPYLDENVNVLSNRQAMDPRDMSRRARGVGEMIGLRNSVHYTRGNTNRDSDSLDIDINVRPYDSYAMFFD